MIDPLANLERFSLPFEQTMMPSNAMSVGRKVVSISPRIKGEFLKGPIPLDWLSRASKLPGKAALSVGLALWFEAGRRRRSDDITLTTPICDRFGVSRKAKYRGLKQLENAALITVVRRPRRNPLVAILLNSDGKVGDQVAGIVSQPLLICESQKENEPERLLC